MISSCAGIVGDMLTTGSVFDSTRLLKIRSVHSELPPSFFGPLVADTCATVGHYSCQVSAAPLSVPSSAAQCSFAPRPGAADIQAQQFNSLPRECYRNNDGTSSVVDAVNLRLPFQNSSHRSGSGCILLLFRHYFQYF